MLDAKTRKRAILALLLVSLLMSFSEMVYGVLEYIKMSYSSADPLRVDQIVGLPGLIGLVAGIIVGPLTLKINKKLLTVISAATIALYFIVFSVVGSSNLTMLLLVAGCIGISYGTINALVSGLIAEYAIDNNRGMFIGISSALASGFSALLSLVGGVLAAPEGGIHWNRAYIPGAILSVVILVVFIVLLPNKTPLERERGIVTSKDQSVKSADPYKGQFGIPGRVWIVMFFSCIFSIGVAVFSYNISEYVITTHSLGTSVESGIATSLYTIACCIGGFTFGFFRKFFKRWTPLVGILISVLGYFIIMVVTTTIWGAFIGAFLFGFGFNFMFPGTQELILESCTPRYATMGVSLYLASACLMLYITPYVLQFMTSIVGEGVDNAFLGGIILFLIGFAGLVYPVAITKRRKYTDIFTPTQEKIEQQ